MNKKKFLFLPLLTLLLSSCLFDTDDDGLSSWLSDQGMPSSYKVQTVTVSNIKPESVEVGSDSLPKNAWTRGVFGAVSGMSHDIVFDFGLDSASLAKFGDSSDSTKSFVVVRLVDSYYRSKYLPSSVLPIKEDLKLNVSWIISDKLTEKEFNKFPSIADSVWLQELESWKPDNSSDTTISISINSAKKDTLLTFDFPNALVKDLYKKSGNRRLQLRLSAPEASHLFRFYGPETYGLSPRFFLESCNGSDSCNYVSYYAKHSGVISENREECSDCLILHGGTYDSLIVEFPAKPIMKALSDFYGDEFPYTKGNGNDVRQAVVMAEVTFFKDDSKGSNELGLPIIVKSGSYMDSAETVVRRMESYKLDKPRILESGHPNMVFTDGDSISLQVTSGMKDFINRAQDGRNFKMMMRLSSSVLLDKDTLFYDRISDGKDTLLLSNGETVNIADGDTVYTTFPNLDYARYDFTSIKSKPATIKLWLASKRGEE